jgi:4-amino-4-deoxy-L-arabinose transferase-like glycosyltransferase
MLAYAIFRMAVIPSDAAAVGGFKHDGAYIGIVADQVRAGHGLVNPAHFFLFLNPEKLPMPYHNANPGYPLAVAGVASLLHSDAIRAGLIISALASLLLMSGIFFLVHNYIGDWRIPLAIAFLIALFPANWADSLNVVPDALCTALGIWALAVVTRKQQSWWSALLVGALLGGSWLCRSSALLLWPAVLWFLIRRYSPRQAARLIVLVGLAFVAVIMPWLIHTYKVWGSPFRSDASYSMLQSYYALRFGNDVSRFWRSLDTPPTFGAILKTEPLAFIRYYFRQIPVLAYMLLAELTDWHKVYLLPLLGLSISALASVRTLWRTPEFQAAAILIFLELAILNVRASSLELRYLGPALIVFLLLALVPLKSGPRWLAFTVIACFAWMSIYDIALFRALARPNNENIQTREDYLAVAHEFPGPVIVATPYFFTYYSGRSALSPPYANKADLLGFMDKYSVRYLALPTAQLSYYYDMNSLAPAIQPVKQVGSLSVFERLP